MKSGKGPKYACQLHGYSGNKPCPYPGCPRGSSLEVYVEDAGVNTTVYRRQESICVDGDNFRPHRADVKSNGDITYYKWEWVLDESNTIGGRALAGLAVGTKLFGAIRQANNLAGVQASRPHEGEAVRLALGAEADPAARAAA